MKRSKKQRPSSGGSESRFRALVEAIPEPVFIVGARGLSYGNPAAVQLFGYDRLEEALGKDPRSVAHPDDLPQLEQRAIAMLLERRTLAPFEYRVFRRDGTLLTIEVSSIPIEYEGTPSILTFARDATLRKRLEAELLQADRLAVLGLLAGGLAHAMNNPLSYVLLDLEQAERALERGLTEECDAANVLMRLREAHDGAQRIAEVVRRMRTLSRIDDDRRGPVDVRAVLEAALELVGNELRYKGELTTELGDAPPVLASKSRLEQVFLNLLAHAAQSLPEGGEGRVHLVLKGEGQQVIVEVFDDARSRDPAELTQALIPFATPLEGLERALSLPLCRSVVEGLGGEMSVDGTEHGMRVRLVLPAASAMVSSLPPPRTSSQSSLGSSSLAPTRVLVIDADAAVGSAVRLMLEPESSITCVRDANEAVESLLAGDVYDVVLFDCSASDAAGEGLLSIVERSLPGVAARVVLMTARDATLGAFGRNNLRITKPFDVAALRAVVERVRRPTPAQ
ncbi:MAG: PAS domain S-box protein [Myxococcales bacterium]|nr:PAS domain S-box protein [Myxococcales bacterium]